MKRATILAAALLMAVTAALAFSAAPQAKLPKCSMKLCRDVGCSPDVLCASGAHVKSCAEVCNGQ